MAQVIWTDPAYDDLHSIFSFIIADSEYYAKKVIDQIQRRVETLRQHQRIGRSVPEYKNERVRELIEYSYRIIYRIDSDVQVTILRIHHQSQMLPPL